MRGKLNDLYRFVAKIWTRTCDLSLHSVFLSFSLQEALRAAGLQRVARRNSDNIGCPVYRQKYDPL